MEKHRFPSPTSRDLDAIGLGIVSVKSSQSDFKVHLELRTTIIVFDVLIPHSEMTLSVKIIKSKNQDSMPLPKNQYVFH